MASSFLASDFPEPTPDSTFGPWAPWTQGRCLVIKGTKK